MARITHVVSTCIGLLSVTAGVVSGGPAHEASFAGTPGLLAYTQFIKKGSQILTVDPSTKTVTNISKKSFNDSGPSFSPGGTQIVFYNGGRIFTMSPIGTRRTDLTPDADTFESPKWSPDGSQIVYVDNGDLSIMQADGTDRHLITHSGNDTVPDWSPDGSVIAFNRDDDGLSRVMVVTPGGTGLKDLSSVTDPAGQYYDTEPSWAPDSKTLLVVSDRSAGGNEIFEMSRNGSSVEPVTDSPGADSPVFSPDGASIAFTDSDEEGHTEVFTQILGESDRQVTAAKSNSIIGQLSWQAEPTADRLGAA